MRSALPAVLAGVAYGAHRARNARGGKSTVPPRGSEDGYLEAGEALARGQAVALRPDGKVGSAPPMRGEGFHAPPAVSGSKASAIAWSEALSATGKQLSDEGFEDQAVMCFVAAGELDAIGHDSYEPR